MENNRLKHVNDTVAIAKAIHEQLRNNKNDLYYPETVKRFYTKTDYKLLWVLPDTVKNHTWEAMLMLDCVLQFGLNHADFHPEKLLFDKLHKLIDHYDTISYTEKAKFDVLLTDAMITFMNQLHYGKLNPDYPARKIDREKVDFRADQALFNAFQSKEFMSAVVDAQPRSRRYRALQEQMRLMTGQYVGDCYEVPEGQIKKVAINMERLRWINMNEDRFIEVNIPSSMLSVHESDTVYNFKVVVGRPAHPTPILQSTIGYLMTTTRQKSNYTAASASIDFCFPNTFDIGLYGTAGKKLFEKNDRAFSNGNIWVENAGKLAALLLKKEKDISKMALMYKAIKNGEIRTFSLKKTMPIKVIYITSEVKNGVIVTYPDLYNLDKSMEKALYSVNPILTIVK
ncbi:L,D-transpeptidase family protein [Pedobacter cryoconitis]|uniref:L,D-transpeptidase family protein n=1 Tax=Pedobacter cryoconitis TaxID=188932 RepID=UPI0018DCF640|nr:L,D-transpeptidase family protein [Pedobacter cryoconitis]